MIFINDLPEELFFHILNFLSFEEILSLALVNHRFRNNIIAWIKMKRKMNLEKAYLFSFEWLGKFLKDKSLSSKLTELNISGVWYYQASLLIPRCKNLNVLHMIDVKLTTTRLKIILDACSKIEDIAFVWPIDDTLNNHLDLIKNWDEKWNKLKKIKIILYSFYIYFQLIKCSPNIENVTIICQSLSEVSNVAYDYQSHNLPKSLKSLNIYLPQREQIQEFVKIVEQLSLVNASKLFNLKITLGIDLILNMPTGLNAKLRTLEIGQKDKGSAENMETLTTTLDDPFLSNKFPRLRELLTRANFAMDCRLCSIRINRAQMPMLESLHIFCIFLLSMQSCLLVDFPNLKKLSLFYRNVGGNLNEKYCFEEISKLKRLEYLFLPYILLPIAQTTSSNKVTKSRNAKKRRVSRIPDSHPHSENFDQVLKNCSNINTLEVAWFEDCDEGALNGTALCFCNISLLNNLTRLTLEKMNILDGEFFIKIAEGCSNLEFLRLKDLGLSGVCVYYDGLSKAIPSMHNLKHFRLDQDYILPCNNLLSALAQCPKLQRIFIRCDKKKNDAELISKDLISFVCENKNLIFAIFIFDITKTKVEDISKAVKKGKAKYLSFQIYTPDDFKELSLRKIYDFPLIHWDQMVNYEPWILTDGKYVH